MSLAHKCDVCDVLYEDTKGALRLDVFHARGDGEGTYDSWSDVDLCQKCSKGVLALVRPALNNFPEPKA